MTTSSLKAEQFSGLILLTGEDKPGLAKSLFEALSPFSVAVVDISLNQAHQSAIEEDLNTLAQNLNVDIAAIFSISEISTKEAEILTLKMKSEKLHPRHLSVVTKALLTAGANIEDLSRIAIEPFEIKLEISGVSESQLHELVSAIDSGTDFSLTIGA